MKTCLITLYDENCIKFAPFAIKSFETFCKYNNCDLKIYDSLIDLTLAPSWNKLLAIRECLNIYDIVIWADADSIFLPRREIFLEYNNFDSKCNFMTSWDDNGICLSHMIVSNSAYNFKLIEVLLFLSNVKDDSKFGNGKKWEQNTLKALDLHFSIPHQKMKEFTAINYLYNPKIYSDTFFYHFTCMDTLLKEWVMEKVYQQHYSK